MLTTRTSSANRKHLLTNNKMITTNTSWKDYSSITWVSKRRAIIGFQMLLMYMTKQGSRIRRLSSRMTKLFSNVVTLNHYTYRHRRTQMMTNIYFLAKFIWKMLIQVLCRLLTLAKEALYHNQLSHTNNSKRKDLIAHKLMCLNHLKYWKSLVLVKKKTKERC